MKKEFRDLQELLVLVVNKEVNEDSDFDLNVDSLVKTINDIAKNDSQWVVDNGLVEEMLARYGAEDLEDLYFITQAMVKGIDAESVLTTVFED